MHASLSFLFYDEQVFLNYFFIKIRKQSCLFITIIVEIMGFEKMNFTSGDINRLLLRSKNIGITNYCLYNYYSLYRLTHLQGLCGRQYCPPSKNAVSANIKHSRYTSIKYSISSQSTTVVKGCMYICLIWWILSLVMEEH